MDVAANQLFGADGVHELEQAIKGKHKNINS